MLSICIIQVDNSVNKNHFDMANLEENKDNCNTTPITTLIFDVDDTLYDVATG